MLNRCTTEPILNRAMFIIHPLACSIRIVGKQAWISGGPGGGFRGQEFTPEERATVQARRAEGGGGFRNRLMTPLVEAVIEILQAKVQ